jgi:hypothetical protein
MLKQDLGFPGLEIPPQPAAHGRDPASKNQQLHRTSSKEIS